MKCLISVLLLGTFFLAVLARNASATLPVEVEGQRLPSLAPMVERVQDSLVRIAVKTRATHRRDPFDDPFFRRFFDQRRPAGQDRERYAVGVVVDSMNGLILTNEHSVRSTSNVKVSLSDGRELQGQVIGTDATADVAVIKADASGLTAIAIANSDELRVGDFVISIGDPLGGDNTLASGIVSALAKRNSAQVHQNFIRSDAATGPGVLVNLNGELVGLNIAKSAQTAGSLRIGFSTPVNTILRVQDQLVKYGATQRGFLAVQVQDLTLDLANAFNITQPGGAVITSVTEGSNADRAGIEVGDVVLNAGSQVVRRSNDLRSIIGQQFAGDTLDLLIARQGDRLNLQPVLESASRAAKLGTMIHHQLEGATFKELDTRKISTNQEDGVLVAQVKPGSVAWDHGVRENDLIVSANRKSVGDLSSLREAIDGKDVLMLNIVRGNGSLFLLLQ